MVALVDLALAAALEGCVAALDGADRLRCIQTRIATMTVKKTVGWAV